MAALPGDSAAASSKWACPRANATGRHLRYPQGMDSPGAR